MNRFRMVGAAVYLVCIGGIVAFAIWAEHRRAQWERTGETTGPIVNLRVVHNAKSPMVSFEVNGRKFSRTLRGRPGRSAMAGIQVDLREGALVKVTHPEGRPGGVLPVTQLEDAS